jgi:glycerophosphoryl diester phosphodiesterase
MSFPRVVAHRGWHALDGPFENSLGAFRAAIDKGVDAVELDIHRTRDRVLIAAHDPHLPDGRAFADLDYAQLPLLPDGQTYARISDVADLARERGAKLSAEIKQGGYEQQILDEMLSRMPREQLELISFDRTALRAVDELAPDVRTGLLEPRLPSWLRKTALYPAALWVMDKLDWHPSLRVAAKVGADFVSVHEPMATKKFLSAAREQGVHVDVWTVNTPRRMAKLVRDGASGIVTDRPDLALALRPAPLPAAPPLAATG